jgi:glutamate-1-semialdehyde 2,1-aminomutase
MNTKREQLEEIKKFIPSGAQTLSKYPGQFVIGVTPVAIQRGKGAYLWDTEGNKYLDMGLALGPMIFGYANERIDKAVKEQVDKGVIFTLPAEQELELARALAGIVPCAEMSRFQLNGNDATSGAIRLARHVTNRDHVAKCGYHGWQDWSICNKAGRNTGVPEIIKTLTHEFNYNDIASLEKLFEAYPASIAAVILEPVSTEKPQDGFLESVKEIAHKHGALLIFDEVVTGFRWAPGGAQEYFSVIPDIACFGKAISNGYPLSAICGKEEYMARMDEVFVSTTYGGSTLGLSAALEVIRMIKEFGDVQKHMHELGEYLMSEVNKLLSRNGLPMEMAGYGPHPVLKISITDDLANRIVKTYIYQEMNKAGIIMSTSFMIGYVHTKEEIDRVLGEFGKIFSAIKEEGDFMKLKDRLEGEIVSPRTVRTTQ